MDLSIIIVSYKCKEKLQVTLDAVFASRVDFDYEVLVVDNGSEDGTAEMIEEGYQNRLILIKNTNEGFSKANNRGLKVSEGAYKLLLNPDTKVSTDTLQVMMDFMKSDHSASQRIGIGTCKLVKEDGSIDPACVRGLPNPANTLLRFTGLSLLFPKSKFTTGYNLTALNFDEEIELGSCSGAFMFISPECFAKVGLLDEQFFMYGEDIDYCKRALDSGFKVWYYPKTSTVHYKGQSSRKNVSKTLYEFHKVMWLYYRKHLMSQYPFFFSWIVYIGIWSRYLLQLSKNVIRKEVYVSK